jgi:trk system potassium uptake protein TrkH
VFEAVSGFTTTGTTILIGLDDLPRSILYYRSQIQWLGGIGIVVLAVALLPMLGVGGMQLLRAEAPGPVKDAKLTPRITETAKRLWLVYVLLTAICAAAYLGAGMTVFDSITHAFATISTGGFSTHDANLGYFKNVVVQYIAVIFMFLGGVNFSLHFMVWRQRRIGDYFRDAEFKAYAGLMLVSTAVYAVALYASRVFSDPSDAFRAALLQAVSMQTTTGFRTDNFTLWPSALPVILILSTFIGGCAGSSSGGMKVMRWLLMWKQGQREVLQLVHPSAELPVKIGRKPVDSRVIDAVWGFFAVYVVSFGTLMVLLIATGEDQVTAFSAIAACMTNSGAALGEVSATFTTLPSVDKWICVVAMLLGRLEVFPLLVLISPSFWRR